jgi:hypothetical protein
MDVTSVFKKFIKTFLPQTTAQGGVGNILNKEFFLTLCFISPQQLLTNSQNFYREK